MKHSVMILANYCLRWSFFQNNLMKILFISRITFTRLIKFTFQITFLSRTIKVINSKMNNECLHQSITARQIIIISDLSSHKSPSQKMHSNLKDNINPDKQSKLASKHQNQIILQLEKLNYKNPSLKSKFQCLLFFTIIPHEDSYIFSKPMKNCFISTIY
jgi:hypothetical protein